MGWRRSTAGRTLAGAGAALAVLVGVVEPTAASASSATATPGDQCSAGSQSIAITGGTNPLSVTAGHSATFVESVDSSGTFDGVGLRLQLSTPNFEPAPLPTVSYSFDGGSSHAWHPQWTPDSGGGEPYWINVATSIGTVSAGRHTIALTFSPTSTDPQGLFWGTVYLDSLPCDNTLGSASNQISWSNDTGYQPPNESGGSSSGSSSSHKSTATSSGPAGSAASPSKSASVAPTGTATAPPATPSSAVTAPVTSPNPTVDAMAVAHDAAIPPSSGSSVPWIVGLVVVIVAALVGTGAVLRRRRGHLATEAGPEADA